MTRAVPPNPAARAGLTSGIINRAVHHWDYAPPLDGRLRDHDHADCSCADCSHSTMIFPGDVVGHFNPLGSISPGDFELENVFEDHEMSCLR